MSLFIQIKNNIINMEQVTTITLGERAMVFSFAVDDDLIIYLNPHELKNIVAQLFHVFNMQNTEISTESVGKPGDNTTDH